MSQNNRNKSNTQDTHTVEYGRAPKCYGMYACVTQKSGSV